VAYHSSRTAQPQGLPQQIQPSLKEEARIEFRAPLLYIGIDAAVCAAAFLHLTRQVIRTYVRTE